MPKLRRCKDCPDAANTRPAPFPGPRCHTHNREWRKRAQRLAHGRMIVAKYKMAPEQYKRLYEAQGGCCFICRKAKGLSKMLAVEHEHNKEGCEHPPEYGCIRCWRALTCSRCNSLVAFLDVDALLRAVELLTDPPARRVLGDGP